MPLFEKPREFQHGTAEHSACPRPAKAGGDFPGVPGSGVAEAVGSDKELSHPLDHGGRDSTG